MAWGSKRKRPKKDNGNGKSYNKRSNKGSTSVRILSDDERESEARRDELLSDRRPEQQQSYYPERGDEIEIEADMLREARRGKLETKRALREMQQAHETGVQTAAALHKQTRQLQGLGDELDEVNDHIDKAERQVRKLTTNKLQRIFSYGNKKGKGLDKQKPSKKTRIERDRLQEQGVERLNIDDEGKLNLTEEEIRRRRKRDKVMRKNSNNNNNMRPKGTRHIKNDHSGYSKEVREILEEQDDDLDNIGDLLAETNAMANAMNNEIMLQDELINDTRAYTEESNRRINENRRKLDKL